MNGLPEHSKTFEVIKVDQVSGDSWAVSLAPKEKEAFVQFYRQHPEADLRLVRELLGKYVLLGQCRYERLSGDYVQLTYERATKYEGEVRASQTRLIAIAYEPPILIDGVSSETVPLETDSDGEQVLSEESRTLGTQPEVGTEEQVGRKNSVYTGEVPIFVRLKPSGYSSNLGTLESGASYISTAEVVENEQGQWRKIIFNDREGWALAKDLEDGTSTVENESRPQPPSRQSSDPKLPPFTQTPPIAPNQAIDPVPEAEKAKPDQTETFKTAMARAAKTGGVEACKQVFREADRETIDSAIYNQHRRMVLHLAEKKESATQAAEAGDYALAIQRCEELLKLEQFPDIEALRDSYREAYKSEVQDSVARKSLLEDLERALEEEDWPELASKVEEAESRFPSLEEELVTYRQKLEHYARFVKGLGVPGNIPSIAESVTFIESRQSLSHSDLRSYARLLEEALNEFQDRRIPLAVTSALSRHHREKSLKSPAQDLKANLDGIFASVARLDSGDSKLKGHQERLSDAQSQTALLLEAALEAALDRQDRQLLSYVKDWSRQSRRFLGESRFRSLEQALQEKGEIMEARVLASELKQALDSRDFATASKLRREYDEFISGRKFSPRDTGLDRIARNEPHSIATLDDYEKAVESLKATLGKLNSMQNYFTPEAAAANKKGIREFVDSKSNAFGGAPELVAYRDQILKAIEERTKKPSGSGSGSNQANRVVDPF